MSEILRLRGREVVAVLGEWQLFKFEKLVNLSFCLVIY